MSIEYHHVDVMSVIITFIQFYKVNRNYRKWMLIQFGGSGALFGKCCLLGLLEIIKLMLFLGKVRLSIG